MDLDITDHDGSHVPHKLNNRGRFVKRRPHNSSQSAPSKLKAKYQWHNRADEGGDAGWLYTTELLCHICPGSDDWGDFECSSLWNISQHQSIPTRKGNSSEKHVASHEHNYFALWTGDRDGLQGIRITNVYELFGTASRVDREYFYNAELPYLLHDGPTIRLLKVISTAYCVLHPIDTTGHFQTSRVLTEMFRGLVLQDSWNQNPSQPTYNTILLMEPLDYTASIYLWNCSAEDRE